MAPEESGICKLHSGFEERIKELESSKAELWKRWDRMNALLIATLAAIITNLLLTVFKG